MERDNPPGRRERRIAAKRELILETAARLFAEKGFHRTTTRDIADAADVSEGTLYNYFVNKEDLLFGIMENLVAAQDLAGQLDHSVGMDAREFFRIILHQRKAYIDEYDDLLHSILSEILVDPDLCRRYYEQIYRPSLQQLEEHLRARIETGQLQAIDPSRAARFVMALLFGLYFMDVVGDPQVMPGWNDLTDVIVRILFDGLGTGKS